MESQKAKLFRRLLFEVTLIIVTAGVIVTLSGWLLAKRQQQPTLDAMAGPLVSFGAPIHLNGVDFTSHEVSFVLISSPTCHYCQLSESFHVNLFSESGKTHVPLTIVVPDSKAAANYLRKLKVVSNNVRQWRDINVRVPGTPTLIAVDHEGLVRHVWVGQLPAAQESEVLELMRNPDSLEAFSLRSQANLKEANNHSLEELRILSGKRGFQIVNMLEREDQVQQAGVLEIPLAELSVRAPFELDRNKLQVVDCSNSVNAVCDTAVALLTQLHYQVATIGAGGYFGSCRTQRVLADIR